MSDRVSVARPSYRPEQRAGLDPDMRRMVIVAAGLGGALMLVLGGMALSHHARRGIPVIQALAGPVRVKPADPGGMHVMGADDAASGSAERLAPPPEKPQIEALRARLHASTARPVVVAAAHVPAVAAAPPVQKASAVERLPALREPPLGGPPPSGTSVQLAAFETPAAAEQDWGRLAEKMPDLLGRRRPEVVRADLAGHPVWRLRTGGFTNLADAASFCVHVRAHGADCSIAAF